MGSKEELIKLEETDGIHRYTINVITSIGVRLDRFLAIQFPDYSRSLLQKSIHAEAVQVNGRLVKQSYKLRDKDQLQIVLPELPSDTPEPEDIPIEILYEDECLVAVNKSPHLVVHPGRGNWSGTLVNALQFHFDSLSQCAGSHRPGLVHRLDRDTSGIIIVAKTDHAHAHLALQFEQRKVKKEYIAICCGTMDRDSDLIDQPIGYHPYQREKMAIRSLNDGAKTASTFVEVIERFRGFTLVRCHPKTGRTHQIRVHLTHVGCPIVADHSYGGRQALSLNEVTGTESDEILIARQALHAHQLRIQHPNSQTELTLVAPIPQDIQKTIDALRAYRPHRKGN